MKIKPITVKLILLNFLEFAVWGAYLTSLGRYLGNIGLGPQIKWFFAMQGIVSIFMPTLMGIVADRKIEAQKVLSLCHGFAGLFMLGAGFYCMKAGGAVAFAPLFSFYSLSVAFFMPTIAIANSVAYNALTREGLDPVEAFPPIRVFGTIGFICSMNQDCMSLSFHIQNMHLKYHMFLSLADNLQVVSIFILLVKQYCLIYRSRQRLLPILFHAKIYVFCLIYIRCKIQHFRQINNLRQRKLLI